MDNTNIVWGFDEEGDFGFKSGDNFMVFYKWANPTVIPCDQVDFTTLTDSNSKNLWRKIQKAVEEFKQEEGL
jgi:hypothetical protein